MSSRQPDADDRLRAWGEAQAGQGPDLAESHAVAERLVVRAGERRLTRRRRQGALVVVLLAGLAGAAIGSWDDPPAPAVVRAPAPAAPLAVPEAPALEPTVLYRQGSVAARVTRTVEVPGGDRIVLQLGADVLGLAGDTSLEIEQATQALTRLRLAQGALAAQVGPRSGSGRFVVLAGDVEISVVGTRLGVALDPEAVDVQVHEGSVQVSGPGWSWTVDAGRGLRVDAAGEVLRDLDPKDRSVAELLQLAPVPEKAALLEAPREPVRPPVVAPEPALPSVSQARSWLLKGEGDRAIAALQERLAADPDELASWSLLALAQRRAGDTDGAFASWTRVAQGATGAEQAQALYELAVLHQETGDAAGALAHLEALQAQGQLNRALVPDARVRMGRAQLAVGQAQAGKETLTEVVRDYPGTQPAATATGILAGL